MVLVVVMNKLKHFVLFFVGIFRRALCCFRRRRRPSLDAVPLTGVGVVSNHLKENWSWEELSEPKTVQDHIELYRKRKTEAQKQLEEAPADDLFEDMTPKITRQTKLYVSAASSESEGGTRLGCIEAAPVETGELREWEESGGWEGQTLDWDVLEALREKKRHDRERKLWEQQQKRLEKHNRALGERLST